MRNNSFRFSLQELGGALGDLGTLVPLVVALVLVNGLNATSVLVGVGVFYIVSGIYFRLPMPVQPLKAVAAIAISLGLGHRDQRRSRSIAHIETNVVPQKRRL